MIIREATALELKKIQTFAKMVQQEATAGHIQEGGQHVNIDQYSFCSSTFVLINKHTVNGWIKIGEAIDLYTGELSGVIGEVFVLPKFRRKGYGSLLLNYALVLFKRKGLKKVQLNVFTGNQAVAMYERAGFQSILTLMEKKL